MTKGNMGHGVRGVVRGVGNYRPRRSVTNDELANRMDTSDEWIRQRSGIERRGVADKDETPVRMGLSAARGALEEAGIEGSDLDCVVFATVSPEKWFPSEAAVLQDELGAKGAMAFNVGAACAGFVYGLTLGDSLVRAGHASKVLVVGGEVITSLLNWDDRTTSVLFADGAGALVMSGEEGGGERGLLGCSLGSDGGDGDLVYSMTGLYSEGGESSRGTGITMSGPRLFKRAVEVLTSSSREAMERAEVEVGDIDWFVPHQANARIMGAVARNLNFPEERVVSTVARDGNTSAASIPLALTDARRDGRICDGDTVLMSAVGGGLSYGSVVVRW